MKIRLATLIALSAVVVLFKEFPIFTVNVKNRIFEPKCILFPIVPPEMDGIEATRRIRALSPATKVIILTSFAEDHNVFPSIKAGAQGYLLKNVSPPDLVRAILAAHGGEVQLDPGIAKKLMEEFSAKPDKPA